MSIFYFFTFFSTPLIWDKDFDAPTLYEHRFW